MKTIKTNISNNLKKAILSLDLSYFNRSQNRLINHKLIYCNKWSQEENKSSYELIDLLKVECDHLSQTFRSKTLIQINLLNAPPDCNDQLFHLDYKGDSVSYFIPLVSLNDLNGTEYLDIPEKLLYISDNFMDKKDIISYLRENIKFKYLNSEAYSLIYMPNCVLHRGRKNMTDKNRIMLNILFSISNNFDYPTEKYVLDTEIDEKDRADKILKNRKK